MIWADSARQISNENNIERFKDQLEKLVTTEAKKGLLEANTMLIDGLYYADTRFNEKEREAAKKLMLGVCGWLTQLNYHATLERKLVEAGKGFRGAEWDEHYCYYILISWK